MEEHQLCFQVSDAVGRQNCNSAPRAKKQVNVNCRDGLAGNVDSRAHPAPFEITSAFFFKLPATCQARLGQEPGCLHVIPLTFRLKDRLFPRQPQTEAHAPRRQGGTSLMAILPQPKALAEMD